MAWVSQLVFLVLRQSTRLPDRWQTGFAGTPYRWSERGEAAGGAAPNLGTQTADVHILFARIPKGNDLGRK